MDLAGERNYCIGRQTERIIEAAKDGPGKTQDKSRGKRNGAKGQKQ